MKAFIFKVVITILGILFAINLIYVLTNDKDEFYTEYTNIEIIENIPGKYIKWKYTNGTIEECFTDWSKPCCENHLKNVDYTIKELKSGKVVSRNGSVFAIYFILSVFFTFVIPIVNANTDSLNREEKVDIAKHLMIFLGYNKDKLDVAIKDFNSYDVKRCRNQFGYDLSYSLFETFKRIKIEYNKTVLVNKDINIKEDYYKLINKQ
jgi:hypothetical protein